MNDRELLKKAREMPTFEALKNLFDRFEQMVDEKEPKPKSIVWEPKVGEEYCAVNAAGSAYQGIWNGSNHNQALLRHHNIYKTRELAEKAAQHQRRYNMVAQAVLNLEPDQVVDWSDEDQLKYVVIFNYDRGIWEKDLRRYLETGYPHPTIEKNVQPLLDYLNAKEKEQ